MVGNTIIVIMQLICPLKSHLSACTPYKLMKARNGLGHKLANITDHSSDVPLGGMTVIQHFLSTDTLSSSAFFSSSPLSLLMKQSFVMKELWTSLTFASGCVKDITCTHNDVIRLTFKSLEYTVIVPHESPIAT